MLKTFFPIVLDSTQLESMSCPIRFFHNHIQHISQGSNVHLHAGRAFATGIQTVREHFYNHKQSLHDSISAGVEALEAEYGDIYFEYNPEKSVSRMALALETYFYEFDPRYDDVQPLELSDGTYSIEYALMEEIKDLDGSPILHPILQVPLLFSGRLDLLAEYAGKSFIVDEKSTGGYFSDNWSKQWETRGQFSAYCWLGKQSQHKELQKLNGAIIRGISLPKAMSKDIEKQLDFYSKAENIRFTHCMTNRNSFEVECWHRDMIKKVKSMVDAYSSYMQSDRKHPELFFSGNWGSECNGYGSACKYQETCKSPYGNNFLDSAEQFIWRPELHVRQPLDEFLHDLGLEAV